MMVTEYYQTVFNALRNRRMSDIAKAAYDTLRMPIVVTDASFVVLAKFPVESVGDEQWDANKVNSQIEPRFVKTFSDDGHFMHHAQADRPILIDWGHYARAPRLTAVVRSNGEILGYCSALTTGFKVEEWHFELIEVVAEAFAILMDADVGVHASESSISSAVLYAMLNGTDDALEDFEQLIDSRHKAFPGPYVLICGRTKDSYNTPLESYFAQATAQDFEPSIQTVLDGLLYILVADVGADYREKTNFHFAVQNLKLRGVICGISRRFDELADIGDYKWQAERALAVGSSLRPDKYNYHYGDYGADIVLDALVSAVPSSAFEHPALEKLKQVDAENKTDYYKTAKAYVDSRYDKKQTAELLHIHRNTLLYRLDRIAELVGFDLSDPTQQPNFSLYFAVEDHLSKAHGSGESASLRKRSVTDGSSTSDAAKGRRGTGR